MEDAIDLSVRGAATQYSADLSVIEDARLAAIELSAESAADEYGVLLTERVAAYAREHGMAFPDARRELKAALSGDLRRSRDRDRKIRELAEEREISYSDAAVELAEELDEYVELGIFELADGSQGDQGRWRNFTDEDVRREMRETGKNYTDAATALAERS